MSKQVSVFEVGPRDGLQAEKSVIATADKIRLVDLLSATGIRRIEVTSFVSPKWVPQMSDADQVCAMMQRPDDVDAPRDAEESEAGEALRDRTSFHSMGGQHVVRDRATEEARGQVVRGARGHWILLIGHR